MKRIHKFFCIFALFISEPLAFAGPFRSAVITPLVAPFQLVVPKNKVVTILNFTHASGGSANISSVPLTVTQVIPAPNGNGDIEVSSNVRFSVDVSKDFVDVTKDVVIAGPATSSVRTLQVYVYLSYKIQPN